MDKEKRKIGEKYLKRWGQYKNDIDILQNQIYKEIKKHSGVHMVRCDDIATKEIYKQMYDEMYKEILEGKKRQLKKLLDENMEIDTIIDSLEEYQREIIRFRYIHKKSWQNISIRVHISLRQCFYVKNFVILTILNTTKRLR